MKKETIVAIIISLVVGLVIGTQLTVSQNNSQNKIAQLQEDLTQQKEGVESLKEDRRCLLEVSQDMQGGINWCLGFNSFCVAGGSGENLEDCRDCIWRVYNYGAVERNKCEGVDDLYGSTLGICDFGWGIKGNMNVLPSQEYNERCNN